MYEQYTHYVPVHSPRLKQFVIELATYYANMCDHVIAPSQSVKDMIIKRGVKTPIDCIPTGVYIDEFTEGDGKAFRSEFNIPADAFVVGHVGRLAPEKNLEFLAEAVAEFLKRNDNVYFLVIGSGPSQEKIKEIFQREALENRLYFGGKLQGQKLVDGYHAMNIFAFTSKSETQGMVLVEAMASGLPVIALDASGAREVVHDHVNGRLLHQDNKESFAEALQWFYQKSSSEKAQLMEAAKHSANDFSMQTCAEKMLAVYEHLLQQEAPVRPIEEGFWHKTVKKIRTEFELIMKFTDAMSAALSDEQDQENES